VFGYIRVAKPEMRIKEYDMYKAVYCSLCRKLNKEYGFISKFALNYDFTFTALLELSLNNNFSGTAKKKCTCNPFKKCNYCVDDKAFDLSAAALIILSFNKFSDDINDEKGIKKLAAFILKLLFSKAHKKAADKYPEIEKIATRYIKEQTICERNKNCSLDDAAEPSSEMLSTLLPMCAREEKDKKVLSYLGRLLGRYIYLLDCLVDRRKDIKNGTFNPIKAMDEKEAIEKIKTQLYIVINEAEKSFELLSVLRFKNILGNLIYVGLEDTMNMEITRMEKIK